MKLDKSYAISDWLNDGVDLARDLGLDSLPIPLEVIENLRDGVQTYENILENYMVLLEAMAGRDPELDTIWMEQYAKETLKILNDALDKLNS